MDKVLVASNGGFRRIPMARRWRMALIWFAIFVVVAVAFSLIANH